MAEAGKGRGGASLGEFEIIARYFAPLATGNGALGLRDDAALIDVPPGMQLVVSCDTIVEGIHFLAEDPAAAIGQKALAVNLSDLAAKGAEPHAYLLALSQAAPPDEAWLGDFSEGLHALQQESGIALIGGDTTRTTGPLTITITVLGLVPAGRAVLRSGLKPGDRLYVSGTIGDAALGLKLLRDPSLAATWHLAGEEAAFLIDRYRRPRPRNALASALREHANAAIDLSDGLAGDIEKLCRASGLAGEIDARRVPFSAPAQKALQAQPDLLEALIAGGDDYEIAAGVPETAAAAFEQAAMQAGVAVTAIGPVTDSSRSDLRMIGPDGRLLSSGHKGFAHF